MSLPEWGTAPIKCSKRKCNWKGYETDLKSKFIYDGRGVTTHHCPLCDCDSYYFMTEKEIKKWQSLTN